MKDNLNIEKLFKGKLENFEGDVNPNLWNNISQGISANTAITTGTGLGVKALIISASVAAISVTTYFVGGFNEKNTETINRNVDLKENIIVPIVKNNNSGKELIIIAEDNDPVITENEKEIIKELSNRTVVYSSETQVTELIDGPVSVSSVSNKESKVTAVSNENIDEASNEKSLKTEADDKENVIEEKESIIVFPMGKLEYLVNDNIYEYSFNPNANNESKINWNFGDGSFSKNENPTHTYSKAGEYKVTLTLISKDNEVYEESKIIKIKTSSSIDNIPNVITPNGDRINDQFVIKTTDIETFTIVINDQFGNKIFESNDQNFTWDGRDMSGNLVEKAVYIYYILATGADGTVLKIPGQVYVR